MYNIRISVHSGFDWIVVWQTNHTGDDAPIFTKALDSTGNKGGLECLNKHSCLSIKPVISLAIKHMEDDPDSYKDLSSSSDYFKALNFLKRLFENCVKHSQCRVFVN